LATHISKLIEAPQSALELGHRAYQRAQQLFDFKLMLRAHAETYIQLAATPKR